MDIIAPPGKYDSVIVLTRFGKIQCDSLGLSYFFPEGTNGMGYSFLPLDNLGLDSNHLDDGSNAFPEEVFVHEWLHHVEGVFEKLGLPFPELDDAGRYGYAWEEGRGYERFLQDILRAQVWDPELQRYIGISGRMWAISPRSIAEERFKTTLRFPAAGEQESAPETEVATETLSKLR